MGPTGFALYCCQGSTLCPAGSQGKCQFLTKTFKFLGITINTAANFSCMQDDRIQSILAWRAPKSIPETGSRLAALSYFQAYLPALKKLALPIITMVNSGIFQWTQIEQEAWEKVRFVVSLNIRNHIHNPNLRLILTTDASQVSIAFVLYQWNLATGFLELITCGDRILKLTERRKSPVERESLVLMFGLTKTEAYIRANEKETLCLTDASSLQYIQRTKNFSSKVFNYSIYISSLPRLSILYVPGQSLLLCVH